MNRDRELLQRARAYELEALAIIFDEYYQSIYHYCFYHTRHIQTAEDLAAKVFQRLLEKIHTGQGPEQQLKAWLFRVAYNLIVDDSRRQQHRNHHLLHEEHPAASMDIEASIARSDYIEQAFNALANLTRRQRDIIILRYVMEMAPGEIAEILGVTVGSVKALQHRGLQALRRELQFDLQEAVEDE